MACALERAGRWVAEPMSTNARARQEVGAQTDAPTTSYLAYTIYGEPYRVFKCLRCGDEWTSSTPNEGCESCR